jgi:hypothetical protein
LKIFLVAPRIIGSFQGEQIVRIVAYWKTVYFGQFLKITYRGARLFWKFYTRKKFVTMLT